MNLKVTNMYLEGYDEEGNKVNVKCYTRRGNSPDGKEVLSPSRFNVIKSGDKNWQLGVKSVELKTDLNYGSKDAELFAELDIDYSEKQRRDCIAFGEKVKKVKVA